MTHHYPTSETRAEVAALVSFGITQDKIALHLEISIDTLDRHYRKELDTAVTNANAKVASRLFAKATDGDDLTAMIFWLKTRARWRERDDEHANDSVKQTEIDRNRKEFRDGLDAKNKKDY